MEILIVVAVALAIWKGFDSSTTSTIAPDTGSKGGKSDSGNGGVTAKDLLGLGSATIAAAGGIAGAIGGGSAITAGVTGAVTGGAGALGSSTSSTAAIGAAAIESGATSGATTATSAGEAAGMAALQGTADVATSGSKAAASITQSTVTGAGEAAGNATQPISGTAAAGSGAIGAAVIFGIVGVYMVFAAVMSVLEVIHNAIKTFERALFGTGLATAEAARFMSNYEYDLCTAALTKAGVPYTTSEVRDSRFDLLPPPGSQVRRLGFRKVISAPSLETATVTVNRIGKAGATSSFTAVTANAKWLEVQKSARALALEYVKARGFFGMCLTRMWIDTSNVTGDISGEATDFAMNHCFDDMQPGLGGLNQIPLVGGATISPRADASAATPPVAQLVGNNTAPSFAGVPPVAIKNAQMMGIISALSAVQLDPNVYVPFSGVDYAANIYRMMGLTPIDDRYPAVKLDGELFVFPSGNWSQPYDIAVNVRAFKDGDPAFFKYTQNGWETL